MYSDPRFVDDNSTTSDNPEFHNSVENDEYMYDNNGSSVKLYCENVVGTGKVGEALPFQIVDEFRGYVINNFAPKFIDNAGWDCNVTWEMKILTTSTLLRALLGHVTIYYN